MCKSKGFTKPAGEVKASDCGVPSWRVGSEGTRKCVSGFSESNISHAGLMEFHKKMISRKPRARASRSFSRESGL